jgi:hypothetical protein
MGLIYSTEIHADHGYGTGQVNSESDFSKRPDPDPDPSLNLAPDPAPAPYFGRFSQEIFCVLKYAIQSRFMKQKVK